MVSVLLPGPRGHSSTLHDLSKHQVLQLRAALLMWFSENARSLPWRIPSVPFGSTDYEAYSHRLYRCLISETMLQQTQVKTVIAYYNKWLEKFPTIEELASAKEEDVMACWAGLGYYSRAKRLHQAAQYLVENFTSEKREFPRDPEHWIKKVPGVGPYTAGAIISISFDIPSAIIDGNVQRVLSRVLAVHGDTSTPKSSGSKLLWKRAAELVVGPEPGNLNQALMELGATVCNPTNPSCGECPISTECLAYKQCRTLKPAKKNFFSTGQESSVRPASFHEESVDVEDLCSICPTTIDTTVMPDKPDTYIQSFYPFKPSKKAQREETAIVIMIRQHAKIYVEKKSKGLLAGLFDFPTILLDSAADQRECENLLSKYQRNLGADLLGSTTHLFTHIRRTSHVLVCDHERATDVLKSLQDANETGRWVQQDSVTELGVSELFLKNFRLATGVDKPKKRQSSSIQSVKTPKIAKRKNVMGSNIVSSGGAKGNDSEVDGKSNLEIKVEPVKKTSTLAHQSSDKNVATDQSTKVQPSKSRFFAMFERKQNR